MARFRSGLLGLGFLALLLVNASAYLPRPRVAPNHPVGEEAVVVTAFRPNADLRSVPVMDAAAGPPGASGQRVHVFLNYAFEDALNQGRPRFSTWLLLGLGALYGITSLFHRKGSPA